MMNFTTGRKSRWPSTHEELEKRWWASFEQDCGKLPANGQYVKVTPKHGHPYTGTVVSAYRSLDTVAVKVRQGNGDVRHFYPEFGDDWWSA